MEVPTIDPTVMEEPNYDSTFTEANTNEKVQLSNPDFMNPKENSRIHSPHTDFMRVKTIEKIHHPHSNITENQIEDINAQSPHLDPRHIHETLHNVQENNDVAQILHEFDPVPVRHETK